VITVLSWGVIAYGAALSAVLAVLLAQTVRTRAPAVLGAVAAGAFAGPVAWNAILGATSAHQFFVDAPIPVFPISPHVPGGGAARA
jgi:hydroxyethylthiazole kinase-like sugar kinase family protein